MSNISNSGERPATAKYLGLSNFTTVGSKLNVPALAEATHRPSWSKEMATEPSLWTKSGWKFPKHRLTTNYCWFPFIGGGSEAHNLGCLRWSQQEGRLHVLKQWVPANLLKLLDCSPRSRCTIHQKNILSPAVPDGLSLQTQAQTWYGALEELARWKKGPQGWSFVLRPFSVSRGISNFLLILQWSCTDLRWLLQTYLFSSFGVFSARRRAVSFSLVTPLASARIFTGWRRPWRWRAWWPRRTRRGRIGVRGRWVTRIRPRTWGGGVRSRARRARRWRRWRRGRIGARGWGWIARARIFSCCLSFHYCWCLPFFAGKPYFLRNFFNSWLSSSFISVSGGSLFFKAGFSFLFLSQAVLVG